MAKAAKIVEPVKNARARSTLKGITPYKQGRSDAGDQQRDPIKLSSNESPLGPSPHALEAYQKIGAQLFRYPDGAQTALREAIGDVFSLTPAQIICGNGSEELQLLLVRAFLSPGDEVVFSEHAFVMGRIHAQAQGCDLVVAPEPNYRADADEILKRITPKTRMIMLASPNNPIGDYMRREEFKKLIENTPPDVYILYDGAYADYVDAEDFDDGLHLVDDAPNVVVTRTFSKLYGLAGLRIGWMYCDPSVVEPIQLIRTPFNANIAAMAAAEAAVRDRDYALKVKMHNKRWREHIVAELREFGLTVFSTASNFYLVKFDEAGEHTAKDAAEFLIAQGIIPRPMNAGGPSECLRITIGLDHENEAVLRALRAFLQGG